ncbi:MAG: hypothetical protein QM640_07085 [Niabella sp.]
MAISVAKIKGTITDSIIFSIKKNATVIQQSSALKYYRNYCIAF